ncbi:hypothetical protein GCM10027436_23960 [Actinophytocola sediminis]
MIGSTDEALLTEVVGWFTGRQGVGAPHARSTHPGLTAGGGPCQDHGPVGSRPVISE